MGNTGTNGATMSQRVARAACLAIISICVLVVGKLAIGFGTGAVSILSEAAHSGVDLIVAFLVWVAVRYAHRPTDQSHPFGPTAPRDAVEILSYFMEQRASQLVLGEGNIHWASYERRGVSVCRSA